MGEPNREVTPLERDWLVERVLAPLVPEEWRETFVGDLVEEARRFVLPSQGPHRARRWLRWQIARSLPRLLRHHATREARMIGMRLFFAMLLAGLGTLQAWDSQVHHATPLVIGLVAAALVLVAFTTLFARRRTLFLLAILAAPVLLVAARLLSPAAHNDLLTVVPVFLLGPLWLGGWLPPRQGTAKRA
jgi:hypothetical protein